MPDTDTITLHAEDAIRGAFLKRDVSLDPKPIRLSLVSVDTVYATIPHRPQKGRGGHLGGNAANNCPSSAVHRTAMNLDA